jgi:hypothetical protein
LNSVSKTDAKNCSGRLASSHLRPKWRTFSLISRSNYVSNYLREEAGFKRFTRKF